MFSGDQLARARVGYQAPSFIQLAAKLMEVSEGDVERQWKQLMYFFATIFVVARTSSLLPGNKPLQPPPRLEALWRLFRERMPEHVTDYCQTFVGGQDVGWREEYPSDHQLTHSRLQLIQQTAGMIGLEVDGELWAF